MSIVIDPSVPTPTPPVEVVSPDGVLTVRRDDPHAGVYLIADYTAATPRPERVRFVRIGADGAEVPVRGGDTAWAPGGVAVAYDHEAPLGGATVWHAYPISSTGTVGARSAGAAVAVPEPEPLLDVWIKSIADPALSMRVLVTAWPALEYAERQQKYDVLGSSSPVMRVDVWALPASSMTIETSTLVERAALLELLTSGTTVLVQTRIVYGRPDAYWVPGKVTETMPGDAADPYRRFDVALTSVDRPTTIGAPVRIPGRSYADSAVPWPTYADRTATGQTYRDVTVGA
ncbi:hypothetical protein ABZ714_30760 [Streptomyces sp. NPDC006798]|uniref:hypothetical protein n=1 Tax=Streptomyces sp. NPDC006798 TaxID=3155462 RepID=UPI0033F3A676